ncbi:CCE_0567 family metalloprotein [Leptolyngbya sp. KIOST-1]|uniref:CCE_0567 family metalloprotein n=1 Tax=Leptolyngbya sp. KIOST-1 TaxID=1229172 RepID=UPI00068A78AD|nr:CCE_0567 family metalloprotein [Leptolyngbya sp. KIOST-1]
MTPTTDPIATDPITIDALKGQIKKLNSKAGQLKMDLHDIAEGLPADLDLLPDIAARTHEIYCQLRDLRAQLTTLEQAP